MKKGSKGFTLIELLIVTVVIVMLMGIVFRLAGTGGESTKRAITIARLQKLSNAIGGYYAAFGSYPPVPLQGRSRNIYTSVNENGVQAGEEDNVSDNNSFSWKQIQAACRAQPVALTCPFNPHDSSPVNDWIKAMAEAGHAEIGELQLIKEYGGFNRGQRSGDKEHRNDWKCNRNSIFVFGLMSFLLPRYEIMMDGLREIYDSYSDPYGPWATNNRLPFFLDGTRLSEQGGWAQIQNSLGLGPQNSHETGVDLTSDGARLAAKIRNLPSQAACARWMPNLEGIVTFGESRLNQGVFFGVNIMSNRTDDYYLNETTPEKLTKISKDGYSGKAIYLQNVFTVRDGWGNDFYYYSPTPYQSYILWSSGPDGKTFPPWMEAPSGRENEVNGWIKDDIRSGNK